MAQSNQGVAIGKDISSQCAHRRIMPPDPHDDCARRLRSDAKLGGGQGDVSTTGSSYRQSSGAGPEGGGGAGIGPGSGGGHGNAIGPGSGGGQGKGRR
jgi:hypothetical protein